MTEPDRVHHVVMFSGGAGSWAAGKRVVESAGAENVTLLFADTMMEDEDLYRFLDEASANIGAELVRQQEGRDPWQVFFDERFLGNTRVDPCSKLLKRKFLRRWLKKHHDPTATVVHLGISWDEANRLESARRAWTPWEINGPMCAPPYLTRQDVFDWIEREGIALPRLYKLGFPHNNCGGFCIKAGQAHFKLLFETFPDRYKYHEAKELELREMLGEDVAILRDRRGGQVRPLTLREFRETLEAGGQCDIFEWGGCGCFTP